MDDGHKFKLGIERSSDAVFLTDPDGAITYVNPAFERLYGIRSADAVGKTPRILKSGVQSDDVYKAMWADLLAKRVVTCEFVNRASDGRLLDVEVSANPILDEHGELVGFLAIQRDISERVKAKEAHGKLEQQLRQAQKMEAVGQLAGGVAHDFNNILSIILSYASLATAGLAPGDPLREDIQEIEKAGRRAVEVTGQLLAFSRRQVLQPRVVDINDSLAKMEKMLRRLLGEDVELETVAATPLWPVKVDPGSMEQILMNLAVNARDAMPRGGKLRIETGNVELDAAFALAHPGSHPGPHVLLSVTDTGSGMDRQTLAHIFEPFFTTKEVGKGTGLGLSTVLGIVQQSGGSIGVESEPGVGTTFEIYFPRCDPSPARHTTGPPPSPGRRGRETILLAEDDEQLRHLVQGILRRQGFEVLSAPTPAEALRLAERHPGRIDLLLTDVVMPGMNGRELAERLHATRPHLRVLFMSGYPGGVLADRGVVDEGTEFLAKPITPAALLRKVSAVLEVPSG